VEPNPDRRRFLRHATALAVSAGAAAFSRVGPLAEGQVQDGGPAAGPLPIVDTHQHLWDLSRFSLPWIEPGSPLARNFLMADYLAATAGLGVVRSVYMEVDVAPAQQVAEAEWVIEACERGGTPLAGAVISGRPAAAGFPDYLARFRDRRPIKGLRQVLHGSGTPPGYCLDPAFLRGIRLLGEAGLSFDVCMRPAELPDAARLIDACPGTAFVLDHCGNADVRAEDRTRWRDDITRIAARPNVVGKVSGIVASARGTPWTADDLAPIVDHVLDAFGPDRVVFGGDWPVCTLAATYRQWVEALRTIVRHRPAADQRKLFHDNAVRVYRLSGTRGGSAR
jgi:L-fuconolactonase